MLPSVNGYPTVTFSYPYADSESREPFYRAQAARSERPNRAAGSQARDFSEYSTESPNQAPDLWALELTPQEFSRPET